MKQKFFFGLLLLALFFNVSTSHAQFTGEENFTGEPYVYKSNLGRNLEIKYGIAYSSSTPWGFKDYTISACQSWLPFDEEILARIQNIDTGEYIATSTSVVSSADFPACNAVSTSTFSFEPVVLSDTSHYAVVLTFLTGYTNSDHYLKINSYGNNTQKFYPFTVFEWNYGNIGNTFNSRPSFDVTLYTSDSVSSSNSGTIDCITASDMATNTLAIASNTEAVYAVGYSINLYLGILLALIFGVLSFKFFKKFIP